MTPSSPQRPARDTDEPSAVTTLIVLWRTVRKNWLLAVIVGGSVLLGTTFFTLGQTKIYRSSTTIQIDPSAPRPLGKEVQAVVEMGNGSYLNNKEYFETQYKVLQSNRVAGMTVQELGLQRDMAFVKNAPPGAPRETGEVTIERAAAIVLSRLDVEPIKNSRLTLVAFEDANPQRAQRILSTLIEKYRENNLDTVLDSTTSAVDWLQGQLGTLNKELETSEMALHDFKKDRSILSVSIDDQSNMLRSEMQQLNDKLTGVRAQREHLTARKGELTRAIDTDPLGPGARELLSDPVVQKLRAEYINANRERLETLGAGKGEAHPLVQSEAAAEEATRKALIAAISDVRAAVIREHTAISQEAKGLEILYKDAQARALELNLLEIEYNRLRRNKENTEKLYSLVLERTKESDLTRMIRVNNVSVMDPATAPKEPVKPVVPLNLAFGAGAGLLLGLFVAAGREMLDRSVKTPDDVERELSSVLLGILPTFEGGRSDRDGRAGRRRKVPRAPLTAIEGAPELVVHSHPTSAAAEAARAIRTNILFMDPDKPFRTLLVTSAVPFEGKTTVACCIAIAMAQAGQKVVLVDCDMRRPRIHRIFRASAAEGVTTVMLDPSTFDRAVITTEVENLSVLPCGPIPPNPAELLHSESFGRLLETLKQRFDRVVIDSPPLVPVTDGTVLSARVDGTVLVMRAFQSSKDIAKRALRALHDVGGRVVGCVLNAVDLSRSGYGYYQQYYYYRKDGYAPDPAEAPLGKRSRPPRDEASA